MRTFVLVVAGCVLLTSSTNADTRGYWRFEETSDPVVDWGPYGLNGTTTNAVRTGDVPVDPIPQNGFANMQSLYLGGDGYVTVPDDAGLLDFDQSFTIEAWVKLSRYGDYSHYGRQWLTLKKRINGGDYDCKTTYGLLVNGGSFGENLPAEYGFGKTTDRTGSELLLAFGGGSDNPSDIWWIASYLEVDNTDWNFVSVAFDADNDAVRFNINDEFDTISFTDLGHFIPEDHGPLVIGAHQNNDNEWNQFLDGSIDEVRISSGVVPEDRLLNVPEPATLAMLVAGVLGFLRRR
ncbi:MAG TPA: LamG-like jellyroll fold domain-containing protein [Phycisphaerae bacterium]|nr:LamG-like jellyroll fold domain-containing protein [Phycisphaerae bacterium]